MLSTILIFLAIGMFGIALLLQSIGEAAEKKSLKNAGDVLFISGAVMALIAIVLSLFMPNPGLM